MAWRWYVYEVQRDGIPVYVGKGCGGRARQSAKERCGMPMIIAHFQHEADALKFERQRIAERIKDGFKLLNISHGSAVAWHRRTDTREMAREVLQQIAWRCGSWIRAGKLHALSLRMNMSEGQILKLYQQFGR